MDGLLTQVGVGGIFGVLIVREVLGFLRSWQNKRNGSGSESMSDMFKLARKMHHDIEQGNNRTQQIYDMHNVKDSDGVYMWYVKGSMHEAVLKMQEAVVQLSANVDRQTTIFEHLIENCGERHDDSSSKK